MGKRLDSPEFLTGRPILRAMGRDKAKPESEKVNKTGLALPQAEPLRDRSYLDWGALLPCAACGALGECVMHHLKYHRKGGVSYRESDDRCCPLCPRCHVLGSAAVHNFKGHELKWWQFLGIDADMMAAWLRESFLRDPRDLDYARYVIVQCRARAEI